MSNVNQSRRLITQNFLLLTAGSVVGLSPVAAQVSKLELPKLEAVSVAMSAASIMNKDAIRVTKNKDVKELDEPTFAKLKGVNFKNGTIEVKVLGRLLKDAPEGAKGYLGIAFRINENHTKFEGIYVRPANGRAAAQLPRNRTLQYFSFPEFKFERLWKETPGVYEAYADMGLNEWIDLKIEVKGVQAKLFVNQSKQPSLIVNDLKHGADLAGGIGLWVDDGTEAYFADLKIQPE